MTAPRQNPTAPTAQRAEPRTAATAAVEPTPAAPPAAEFGPAAAPIVDPPLPRVAILVAGIGMSVADSTAAIETLPPQISLALSPYAADPSRLVPAIKTRGHEFLLSLPMEPENHPLNDADADRALMTSVPEEENLTRLHTILTRLDGYAGVTNVLGAMHGERFLANADLFNAVLRDVARRGLFFIDTGNHPPQGRDRSADMVLDDAPLDAVVLDERLDRLLRLAQEKGTAIGVVGLPRPVVRDRIAAWSQGLAAKGVALVPVGALIPPLAQPPQEKAR